MKVTKLIREYVERAVDSAYPEPNSVKILKEANDRMEEAKREVNERVKVYVTSILPTIKEKYNIPDEFNVTVNEDNFYSVISSSRDNALRRKVADDKIKVEKEKKNKRDEILLALELGANRAELDEMIKNLMTKQC